MQLPEPAPERTTGHPTKSSTKSSTKHPTEHPTEHSTEHPAEQPARTASQAPDTKHAAAERRRGMIMTALSAAGFGAIVVFVRLAYADGAEPLAMLTLRFWIAGLTLLAVAQAQKLPWPPFGKTAQLAAMGGIGYVGMSFCYFSALGHIPASLAALLLYTYPLIVSVLAVLFLKERFTLPKLAVLLMCATGTALVIGANGVGGGPAGPPQGLMVGIGFALSAAVVYACYIAVGSRVAQRTHPLVTTTVVCLAAAGVFSVLVAGRALFGHAPRFPGSWVGYAAVLAIAWVSTVVAVLAFFAGLKRIGATQASMLSTLEPVVAVALSGLLLGESLGGLQYLGGALTLGAVLWLARMGGGQDART